VSDIRLSSYEPEESVPPPSHMLTATTITRTITLPIPPPATPPGIGIPGPPPPRRAPDLPASPMRRVSSRALGLNRILTPDVTADTGADARKDRTHN
jgi:hypothetical protein